MGHTHALVARWSRRDRLAVVVVAVTVAFLTGSSLLFVATTEQTTDLARDFDSQGAVQYHESVAAAREAATGDAVVVPAARVTGDDGTTAYVLGVSAEASRAIDAHSDAALPSPQGEALVRGGIDSPRSRTLTGPEASLTVDVAPAPRGNLLPPSEWYVGSPALADRFGTSGAFVYSPPPEGRPAEVSVPAAGAPLVSALGFFVLGTRRFLALFGLLSVGAGILVGATVYSVMRMTVRDRLRTVRIVRATGGTAGHVRRLFALRALGLVAVGTAVGYAVGVILPNAAVNLAVFLGVPTSLSLTVSGDVVGLIGPAYLGVLAVGLASGYLATWSTSRRPPAHLESLAVAADGGEPGRFGPIDLPSPLALLDWRPLVATTATLTVFLTFVLVLATVVGVVGPAVTGSGTTITESGAPHPVASQLPESYADALGARGVDASGEILLFGVADGRSFLARGADFDRFAAVSNATLVSGRSPETSTEAVVGEDLAATLDVDRNDSLLLGGSTRPGFTRVTVAGTYAAQGPFDDQVIVPLDTARDVSTVGRGRVNFVRTATDEGVGETGERFGVVGVTAPERVGPNESVPVRVTLVNAGDDARTANVTARLGRSTETKHVSLDPGDRQTVRLRVDSPGPGNHTLRVGERSRSVTVVDPNALLVRGLPDRIPPDAAPLMSVQTTTGRPVENATVETGDERARTGPNGTARVRFGESGSRRLVVRHDGRTVSRTVRVESGSGHAPQVTLRTEPRQPDIVTEVRVVATVRNPWETARNWSLMLETPEGRHSRTVSLGPGEETTVGHSLGRLAPGEHELRAAADGRTVATRPVRVTGDERLMTALATRGTRSTGTSFDRALTVLFGNLNLIVVVLVGLAGLMTVGSTTAAFARAIRARRRTIGVYRATGAGPGRVLALVLRDAAVVGTVATAAALCLAVLVTHALAATGRLTFFGVRFSPSPTLGVLGIAAACALAVILVGAATATAAALRTEPGGLLRE